MGNLYRGGGWLLLRQWTAAFRKDGFRKKLAQAKQNLASAGRQGRDRAMG
jgi:hypothetical protein